MYFHQSPKMNHNSSKTHRWSQPNTSHCQSPPHHLPDTLEVMFLKGVLLGIKYLDLFMIQLQDSYIIKTVYQL